MKEFSGEQTGVIRVPIGEVYDYLSDFPRHVEWNYVLVTMTKLTDGPVSVGTKFRTKERGARTMSWLFRAVMPLLSAAIGGTGYTEAEITALEPNSRVAWKAVAPLKNGNFMASSEWEVRLEPLGDATRVTEYFHYKFPGKMGDHINPDKSIEDNKQEIAINLAGLKKILENQPEYRVASSRAVA